jgi:hypothetical protein
MTSGEVNARAVLPSSAVQPARSAGKKGDGDPHAQAWQREMERAQMDAWLSHGVLGYKALANAGLLPSAIAAPASLPAVSPDVAAIAGPAAAAAPLPAAQGAASAPTARAAVPGEPSRPPAQARGPTGPASLVARSANLLGAAQVSALAAFANPRTTNVAGADPHRPQPAVMEEAKVTNSGSTPAAPNFNAASLAQALQPFGPVQATTTTAGASTVSSTVPAVDAGTPSRLAAAPQVLTLAEVGTTQPPVGASPASGVFADISPQPQPQLTAPRALAVAQRLSKTAPGSEPSPDAAAEPIRVHAEWSEDGVRLWLGMEAGALNSLDPITRQLQAWLAAQGLRLRSLACNGQIISTELLSPDGSEDAFASSEPAVASPSISTPKEFP